MSLVDHLEPGRLLRMALVLLVGILAVYVEALPFGLGPDAPPSPDLLLCVVVYWSVRQPRAIPIAIVFLLGLTRDLLTDMPAGAGVLSLVLISEAIKLARQRLARRSFLTEWLALAISTLAGTALVWLLLVLTFAQPPYPLMLLHQSLYTVMVYPALVLVLRWVLRIGWSPVEKPA